MTPEQRTPSESLVKRWSSLKSTKEVDSAALEILRGHREVSPNIIQQGLDSMKDIQEGAARAERNAKELELFLGVIRPKFREYLTTRNDGSRKTKLQELREQVVKDAELSKGEKLHIRREKAQKRRGTKPGDIH